MKLGKTGCTHVYKLKKLMYYCVYRINSKQQKQQKKKKNQLNKAESGLFFIYRGLGIYGLTHKSSVKIC